MADDDLGEYETEAGYTVQLTEGEARERGLKRAEKGAGAPEPDAGAKAVHAPADKRRRTSNK